jgi:hypothetical protein
MELVIRGGGRTQKTLSHIWLTAYQFWNGKSLVLNPFKIEEQLGRLGGGDNAQTMRPVGARGDDLHIHDGWDIGAGPDEGLRGAVSRTDPMDRALPRRISEPELVDFVMGYPGDVAAGPLLVIDDRDRDVVVIPDLSDHPARGTVDRFVAVRQRVLHDRQTPALIGLEETVAEVGIGGKSSGQEQDAGGN